MLGELVKGKHFLNLFCYTAAASVQAALAGAKSSLSIDMSNTYLDWAGRNFELNSMSASKHELLRADCLKWLEEEGELYDVIFPITLYIPRKWILTYKRGITVI